jgi:hypothetical protein
MTPDLREEMAGIELPGPAPVLARRVLLAPEETAPPEQSEALAAELARQTDVEQIKLYDGGFWMSTDIFVPRDAVEGLASAVERCCP